MGSAKYQTQRKIVDLDTGVRSDNLMAEKLQQEGVNAISSMAPQVQPPYPPSPFVPLSESHPQSAFENPSVSPDEIDYFTETRKFRLRHAMEEDGCGMMSSAAPPTLLTKITGEVWKELRPSIDIETIDLETGYRYDRLLRAKLDKASSLDQSAPAPEHSTHLGHTGLGEWTTPHRTLMPSPSPDQLTDLQQTSIYPPLPPSIVSPQMPPLNEQRTVIGWQPSLLPLHAVPLPSPHASLDVSGPALYHPASIFGPFTGELPAAPQPITHHPPQTELCVSQVRSQKLIRQAACVNMQLQGCSQTHIQPDLGAPLPLNAIFLRRVVSTQGGTQDLWTVGA
uniref:Uncharacterized protein n=1 Tax=Cryptococcus bacillisporus CA1280 TaxID=1296109 RepID=A0A0D0VJV6_CRYGA|nr:hypothetical protein I312_02818 [Cryptococcus bacillisporus CA1280]